MSPSNHIISDGIGIPTATGGPSVPPDPSPRIAHYETGSGKSFFHYALDGTDAIEVAINQNFAYDYDIAPLYLGDIGKWLFSTDNGRYFKTCDVDGSNVTTVLDHGASRSWSQPYVGADELIYFTTHTSVKLNPTRLDRSNWSFTNWWTNGAYQMAQSVDTSIALAIFANSNTPNVSRWYTNGSTFVGSYTETQTVDAMIFDPVTGATFARTVTGYLVKYSASPGTRTLIMTGGTNYRRGFTYYDGYVYFIENASAKIWRIDATMNGKVLADAELVVDLVVASKKNRLEISIV